MKWYRYRYLDPLSALPPGVPGATFATADQLQAPMEPMVGIGKDGNGEGSLSLPNKAGLLGTI
jgi:hypothetical protein